METALFKETCGGRHPAKTLNALPGIWRTSVAHDTLPRNDARLTELEGDARPEVDQWATRRMRCDALRQQRSPHTTKVALALWLATKCRTRAVSNSRGSPPEVHRCLGLGNGEGHGCRGAVFLR